MKIAKVAIWITVPFFLLILFASMLTSKPYLLLSKGLYDSHDYIVFDHDYAIDRIIGYLNYQNDDIDVVYGYYENDEPIEMLDIEISHMVDVKVLYTNLRIGAIISLLLAVSLTYLMYKVDKEELYKTYKSIYLGPLFFVIFVGGYLVIDFSAAFTVFHQLLFTNDDYLIPFNILLYILPLNFWMASGIIILILFSASIGTIYYLNERYLKYKPLK